MGVLPLVQDPSWFCKKASPGSTSAIPRDRSSSRPPLDFLGHLSFEAPGWHLLIWFPVLPRICFPVQVNRLPRETLLCATLYALPIPLPGSSSEANKQRRVPEALGWVTTPLFNFRQYVVFRAAAFLALERKEGDRERGRTDQCPLGGLATWGSPTEPKGPWPWWRGPRHGTRDQDSSCNQELSGQDLAAQEGCAGGMEM